MGLVSDIQRCSLNDGPGIRTTVFLKGCPLRCLWCHNPESIDFHKQISYDMRKCINCLSCTKICKSGCHIIAASIHSFDNRKECIRCHKCVGVCPSKALSIIGKEMAVEDVMVEVLKDRNYYKNSGGGLTLSGGEPMAQFDFTKALLIKAKSNGLNTCIETSGFSCRENYAEILHLTDIFLFDYKATDSMEHKKLTGTDNTLILENLDFIYKQGSTIILRCPLIPGVNDNEHHLSGIAALSRKYPELQSIQIMAYHNMGIVKAENIGSNNKLPDINIASENQINIWLTKLNELGVQNVERG